MIRRCHCGAVCHKDATRCMRCNLAYRNGDRPGYEPSAEEIAAATAEIRAGLSEEQLAKRAGLLPPAEVETREYGVTVRGASLVFSER